MGAVPRLGWANRVRAVLGVLVSWWFGLGSPKLPRGTTKTPRHQGVGQPDRGHRKGHPIKEPFPAEVGAVARQIVDAAYVVHSTLGPGLLESVYQVCLVHELTKRGLAVQRQVSLPVIYDEIRLDAGFRLDLLVRIRSSSS